MVKKSRILKNYSLTPQKRKSNNRSVGDESNVWSTDVQNNGNRRINRKFLTGKLYRWAVMEVRNPTLEACIGETICKMFVTREKLALSLTGWRPCRVW